VDAKSFAFASENGGVVLSARNARTLRASLDSIYRGRILVETLDAGEGARPSLDTTRLPGADSGAPSLTSTPGRR
jgi:hypothetical protein